MAEFWNVLIPIGMAAVVIVLLMGIWNMFRGGPGNKSQMLMRWRVGLQFLVVVLVMGGLYFFGPGR
ncbi:twin transmembrane helix small protein [Roseibium algae]|uniref:Twin transmembrane helix small protein n=1 Tax=Roseibium algae TaxID=3123038 RepID=A0ABU8TMH9_9HYPH